MAKLSLMFENKLVKEVPVGGRPIGIGRSPDNDLPVDNLAVSNYHARVYVEAGRLVVEDLASLNGTFVNDLRVERATLHDGDSIWIGKHHIKVDASGDTTSFGDTAKKGPATPLPSATRQERARPHRASTKPWCSTRKPAAKCCRKPPQWASAHNLPQAESRSRLSSS